MNFEKFSIIVLSLYLCRKVIYFLFLVIVVIVLGSILGMI